MALARDTLRIYERNAARFQAERRTDLIEQPWLDRLLAALPEGAEILDLGCGTGTPIAAYLLANGCHVVGLDGAASMIGAARRELPQADWRLSDMRGLELPELFDAIIAWCSFFHLTQDEQRDLLPRLARHLTPGGMLMLTVGPEAGEAIGAVGDDPVYHASLSQEEYTALLAAEGLEIVEFLCNDARCGDVTVLLAVKSGEGSQAWRRPKYE